MRLDVRIELLFRPTAVPAVIDVHNHLLVNLDDGSRSLERSVGVLRRFQAHGVVAVVCTPHLAASQIVHEGERHIERRDRALAELREVAPEVPRLEGGFEIMLDEPLPVVAVGDRRFALAGSRYYLVEFPLNVAAHVTVGILDQLVNAGVVPVVAHPERYSSCDAGTVRAWKTAGAAVQVDATTLTRPSARGERARALVQAGLVDVLAADNHGDDRGIWTGREYLAARGRGETPDAGVMMTDTNPGHIVADEPLESVVPTGLRRSIAERFKGLWT